MASETVLARELDKLRQSLLRLGAEVELSFKGGLESIDNRDSELAAAVIEGDRKIDVMEIDLEEECLKILALHQPSGSDLRFIITVLKVNTELERIADLATNLAELGLLLTDRPRMAFPFDYELMSTKTKWMVKTSLDALVAQNTEKAREVLAADDEIDEINRNMYRSVEKEMTENSENIKYYINFIGISRCLERIGDLATNVAEDVIYFVSGQIVRH